MKHLLFPAIVLLLFACNNAEQSTATAKETDAPKPEIEITVSSGSFDWLVGDWTRTNEEEGASTFENWKKVNDSLYTSHSYTIEKKDTVWQEHTTLSPINGVWLFQVTLQGETNPTAFRLITTDNNSFSVENKKNKFPQLIKYWKEKKLLKAEISANKKKVDFEFAPTEK